MSLSDLLNPFYSPDIEKREARSLKVQEQDNYRKAQGIFAEEAGFAFGVRGLEIDFERYHQAFKKKFPRGCNPAEFECSFVRGHKNGAERREYAMANGSKRPPTLPQEMQQVFTDAGFRI